MRRSTGKPRSPPAREPARPARQPPAARPAPGALLAPGAAVQAPPDRYIPSETLATRELFWHNVIREILTSLSMLASLRPSPDQPPPDPAQQNASGRPQFDPALFDGRLAVLTRGGERIPIADVFPLFACGISGERALSVAVECTVFQIRTPAGEVFTIPLHEIRSFHALAPELLQRLTRARRRPARESSEEQAQPFGFAAFTSLVQPSPPPLEPAPEHPIE